MKPAYFYLVCAGGELDIRVHNPYPDIPDQAPAYTITQITGDGWETYRATSKEAREVLPYVEAVYHALMKSRRGGWPP